MTEVSAGIVRNEQGLILVCRRGEGRRNAHLWEFPGGKREMGEDAASCLRRELMEELSLPVEDVQPRRTGEEGGIRFTFLTAFTRALPVPTEHEAVRFVHPREMLGLPFCPADAPVARALALNAPPLTDFFWDWDGTLFDTYPLMSDALSEACRLRGIRLEAGEALDLLKRSLSEALDFIARRHGADAGALLRDFRRLESRSLRDTPMLPGMAEALAELHRQGCRHFLVTHRDHMAVDILRDRGMGSLFTGWVTQEDGFPRKPDPTSVLHLMRRHGADPEQACMVGDRPLDVQAGANAGILGCLLDPEDRFPDAPCSLRCRSAAELPDLLRPAAI